MPYLCIIIDHYYRYIKKLKIIFVFDKNIVLLSVECVQSPPAFFAKRVYEAMDGVGTDDTTLIRIVVSRSEIDLGNIKEEFERIYDKTLQSFIAVSICLFVFAIVWCDFVVSVVLACVLSN